MKWLYLTGAVLALVIYFKKPGDAPATAASPARGIVTASAIVTAMPWLSAASAVGSVDRTRDLDENHDGVPDDVNRYIDHEYATSKISRQAMTQLAQGWSAAIHDVNTVADAKEAGEKIARGIACLMSPEVAQKTGKTPQAMYEELLKTRAEMLGTPQRTEAYLHFQTLASGQYFADPQEPACDFKPTTTNTP